MANNYKKELKKDVVECVKKKYENFLIDEKINSFYEMIKPMEYTGNNNLYFDYVFELELLVENYIMKKIKNDDLLFQIELAELKRYVVIRYLSLKKTKKFNNYDELYKYADNLSDEIIESLKEDYEKSESLNKQMVKKLNNKLK